MVIARYTLLPKPNSPYRTYAPLPLIGQTHRIQDAGRMSSHGHPSVAVLEDRPSPFLQTSVPQEHHLPTEARIRGRSTPTLPASVPRSQPQGSRRYEGHRLQTHSAACCANEALRRLLSPRLGNKACLASPHIERLLAGAWRVPFQRRTPRLEGAGRWIRRWRPQLYQMGSRRPGQVSLNVRCIEDQSTIRFSGMESGSRTTDR